MKKVLDESLWNRNLLICGVDEVGRGALAGPVVAAAVVLKPHSSLPGVRDSKSLSARQRHILAERICHRALSWAIGTANHRWVDRYNVLEATMIAMSRAIERLSIRPQYVLIDGCDVPNVAVPCRAIVKGDNRSLSVACASVLAKVYRDALMHRFHCYFPQYGFVRNKGYCTAEHLAALRLYGASPIHRLTFKPLRSVISQ